MACLKCGKQTTDVFCEQCKAGMAQYPINPGTPVSVPNRETYLSAKRANKPKRRITLEDRVESLRKLVKFLLVLWLLTAAALAVFIFLWIFF